MIAAVAALVLAAVAALVLAAVLRAVIPPLAPREPVPYPRLLGSGFTTMAKHRAVLPTLAISAASFSSSPCSGRP